MRNKKEGGGGEESARNRSTEATRGGVETWNSTGRKTLMNRQVWSCSEDSLINGVGTLFSPVKIPTKGKGCKDSHQVQ